MSLLHLCVEYCENSFKVQSFFFLDVHILKPLLDKTHQVIQFLDKKANFKNSVYASIFER